MDLCASCKRRWICADVEKHARRRRGNGSAPADDARAPNDITRPNPGRKSAMFYRARREQITIRELLDETLLYDHQRHKGHCLNATAALVWRHCDGNTSVEELTRIVAQEMGIAQAAQVVGLALEQLGRRHLLDACSPPLPAASRISRGEALKQLAMAAAALPIVMTIATKAVAQVASDPPPPPPPPPPSQSSGASVVDCADDCGAVLCVVVHDHDYGYSACADSTSSALQNKWPKLSGHRGGPTRHALRRPDLRRALAGRGHLRVTRTRSFAASLSFALVPKLLFGNARLRNSCLLPRSDRRVGAATKQEFGSVRSQTGVWERGMGTRRWGTWMGAVKHWHAVRPWRQCWLAPGGHRRRPLRLRLWTQRPGCWHSPAQGVWAGGGFATPR